MVVTMSGTNPAAATTVTGGADEKAALEVEKLRAEIDELRDRHGAVAWVRTVLAVLLSLVTIIGGGWGAFEAASRYFDQRGKELQFQVTGELVALSKQLASSDAIERASAALLLSGYEEHAVPVLAAALRHTDEQKPGLPGQIIESLKLVMAKERVRDRPMAVFDPLLSQAKLAFREAASSSDDRTREAVWNFLDAIGALGVGSGSQDLLSALDEYEALIKASGSKIVGNPRDQLVDGIGAARRAIRGQAAEG
jgi:hypothetical protein